MNYKIILKVLGELLFLEALLFASCIGIALFKSETDLHTFIIPTIVALLTGAALMGSMLKDDRDTITLRVSGSGPAGVHVVSAGIIGRASKPSAFIGVSASPIAVSRRRPKNSITRA